jgi:DNA-binding MarR family transcriptional regulator
MKQRPDPHQSLGFLVHETARLFRREFLRRTRTLGLSLGQWQAISRLAMNEGVNQARLADMLEMQPITVARLIDKMVAGGWVERRADPRDRRAVQLYLTPAAEPLLDELWKHSTEIREQAFANLAEGERNVLIGALAQVKQNLAATDMSSGNEKEP